MENLTGRVTADATVAAVKGDKKVVNFTIAINDRFRTQGETRQVTTYIDCAYWLNAGVAEYLKKGLLVDLYGRLGVRAFINRTGEAQGTITLNVSNIKFLGKAAGGRNERQGNTGTHAVTVYQDGKQPGDDDDLPF